MDSVSSKNVKHKIFLIACRTKDITLQMSSRTRGDVQENKNYLGCRHHSWGYETEVLVLPSSTAIICSSYYLRSVHEILIFRIHFSWNRLAIKIVDDSEIVGQTVSGSESINIQSWNGLLDRIYFWLQCELNAIIPKTSIYKFLPASIENHIK